uniref:ubiquitin carboxyl-terminal hydrolase 29 n=1 Tax=Jaculus jaculus TaxID=51337 RepID=UPI001E1B3334
MAHLKIHGFVQIWSKKTSMAKLKRAVIEIVEGEKEVELVVSSQSRKNQWIFHLSNDASVVLRRRGKRLYHLHLTLKSSASLVVGKLSFTDAKQMKMFLDTFHQSRFPLMKPEGDRPGRSTRKVVNKTLLYIECDKAAYRFFRTSPLSKEKPLSVSNSPINPAEKEILKNRGEKRKTVFSSQDMNADILKEKDNPLPNKKLRRSHLQHESNKREKLLSLNLQEKHRDVNTVPSFNTNTSGYPNPGEIVPSFNTKANGYPNLGETVPSFNTNTSGYPNPGETVPSFNTNANGYPNPGETVPSFNTNTSGYPNPGETVPSFNTNANGYPTLGETVPSFNTNASGYPNPGETVPSFNTNTSGYPNPGETVPSFNTKANGYPNLGETVPSFNTNANGYPNRGETVPSFNTNANGYPNPGETVPSFNTKANGYPNLGETVPSFNTNANGYPNRGETVPSFNTKANGYPNPGETVPSFNTNANGYPNPGETVPSFNTNANGYPNPGETVPSFNTNANGYPNPGETVPSFNTKANGYPNLGETVPSFNTNANGYPNPGETVPSFNTNTSGYPNPGETVPSFNTNANGYPTLGETVPSFNTNLNGYANLGETVPSFNTNASGYPNPGETVPSFNTNASGYPNLGETVPLLNTKANGYPNPGETVPSFNTNTSGYPNPGETVPSFNTNINGYPNLGETVPSFNTNINGYPNPGETVPSFSSIDSPLELEHSQENPCFNQNSVLLDTDPKTPREGFPNLGNTCYMNAVLQSLFAIPSLANDLFTQGIPWENMSNNLIVPFSLLFAFKDISEANTKSMLLLNIKHSISDIAAIFCGDGQHDAHEFLGQCLDQLKEDMKTLNTTWPAKMETQRENSRAHLCAGDAATKVFMCPIVTNFELELQVSIVCRACGQAAMKTELNNYLSINLDCEQRALPLSLQDYFDLFFIPEVVECHCEKCESKSSVFRYKFRRLPRVLIVHLKRYSINEEWLLVKNYQQVKISKYLSLSSHCDEHTKPPLPLESKVSDEGHNVLKAPEMFGSSEPSMKRTTESNDSVVLHTRPDEGGEVQIFQGACEGARNVWQPQSGVESRSKLELVNTENEMLLENKLWAIGSMVNERDTFLPMICQLFGIPYPDSTQYDLQQVPEYPDLKNHEERNPAGESDPASTQLWEDNPTENKMLGGFQPQGVGTGLYQNSAMGNNKEILHPSPPPRVSQLDAQEDPMRGLGRSRGLRSLLTEGSDHSAGRDTTVAEGSEAESEEGPVELRTYRLISVISHIGDSSEGHYVSDVYDFQKQAWFLYNDMSVSEIPEAMVQKLRLGDGYIFFYMHNEIFETLLGEAQSSQLGAT